MPRFRQHSGNGLEGIDGTANRPCVLISGYAIGGSMRKTLALVAALVIAGAGASLAQSASQQAPGHQSGNAKKDAMPGQSGYAPGHQSGNAKKDAMPGQSGYAPGQTKETTGLGTQENKK
jgi:hypothetical protein